MNQYNSTGSLPPLDETTQKVQLYLAARNLLDMDVFSKSDPYIKVFFKPYPNQPQRYLGKTQTIDNNLNPNFTKTFLLDHIFQSRQQLRFQVYDQDNGNNDDFIGSVSTTLGSISGSKGQAMILNLQNKKSKKKPGKLIVRLQLCKQSSYIITMKWRAKNLYNSNSWLCFWSRNDPYLKFFKIRSDNSLILAGKTQVISDNLQPNWQVIQIPQNKLISQHSNNNDKIKIQCWGWKGHDQNKHQFFGQTYVQLSKFKQGARFPVQFRLSNKKHTNPGSLLLQALTYDYRPTFLQYIRGGLQLNLSIAIDFTGSNGIPTQPSSLHFINPHQPNQYQSAIIAVAKILLNYDTDQRIPCYGFGAKPHGSRTVSHCFPLSGNINQTQAFGLFQLMNMYNATLMNVQLSGPTYFAPILSQSIKLAQKNARQGSNTFQILLILTDGQIHDMQQTVNLLVDNCTYPLSIIIVGVGNADFTNMQRLDGDNGLFNSKGKRAQRDIVQFVPFRQIGTNQDLLAKQLLAQLPGQVTSYMRMIKKLPNPPPQLNISQEFKSNGSIDISPEQAMRRQLANAFNANYYLHQTQS